MSKFIQLVVPAGEARADNRATRLSYPDLFPGRSHRTATSRNAHEGPTWASFTITGSSRRVR